MKEWEWKGCSVRVDECTFRVHLGRRQSAASTYQSRLWIGVGVVGACRATSKAATTTRQSRVRMASRNDSIGTHLPHAPEAGFSTSPRTASRIKKAAGPTPSFWRARSRSLRVKRFKTWEIDELERVKKRAEPLGRSLLSSKVTLVLSRVLWERKRGRDSPARDMVLVVLLSRAPGKRRRRPMTRVMRHAKRRFLRLLEDPPKERKVLLMVRRLQLPAILKNLSH
jgi:hypothetical protein